MADIFISYARTDKARVAPLVAALEAEGWSVWWDPAIAPGQQFDDLIAEELEKARAVVVVWTPVSVGSRWVRGEARAGADRGILVPVRFGNAQLPIDVRAIHTTDIDGWRDDRASAEYQELLRALAALLGTQAPQRPRDVSRHVPPEKRADVSILVLPFINMSGDPEQEYFSDGISEDIITDLSKVSALWVAARNTAFAYKGRCVDVPQLAQQQKVSHVLEGSVRKSGNRVRITAQLVDGATGGHVWAERYDRDLNDIFALQDEIAEAIVGALRCRLLPEEKRALGERGTTNPEAYKLYLMARQCSVTGNFGMARRSEAILRLCRRATEFDPSYARAWALMALAQVNLRFFASRDESGLAAAERAIELDPGVADAYAAKARVLVNEGQPERALREMETALRLDPESYEVNQSAGYCEFTARRFKEAISFWEKATAMMEEDFMAAGMLTSAYTAIGDVEGGRRAARHCIARTEKILAVEPDNGSAMGFLVGALAILGERERAQAWAERAMLLDPDNINMHYNIACTFATNLKDNEYAIAMLRPFFEKANRERLSWVRRDVDMDVLRDDPRFKSFLAEAEARVASEGARA